MKTDEAKNDSEPDINARAFAFAIRIVRLCQAMENKSKTSRPLISQLIRSGTSIGANTEEAQASQSRADFKAKMSIACKEARESLYWLRILEECNIIPAKLLENLLDEADQITAILTTIVKKCRDNE